MIFKAACTSNREAAQVDKPDELMVLINKTFPWPDTVGLNCKFLNSWASDCIKRIELLRSEWSSLKRLISLAIKLRKKRRKSDRTLPTTIHFDLHFGYYYIYIISGGSSHSPQHLSLTTAFPNLTPCPTFSHASILHTETFQAFISSKASLDIQNVASWALNLQWNVLIQRRPLSLSARDLGLESFESSIRMDRKFRGGGPNVCSS